MADQERAESGLMPETDEVMRLSAAIKPMLRGVPAMIVGAVLADLTAIHIVSHVAENEYLTKKSREAVLKIQIDTIKKLMPLNEAMIKDKVEAARDDLKAQGKAKH
jgi:hypothetical protein